MVRLDAFWGKWGDISKDKEIKKGDMSYSDT